MKNIMKKQKIMKKKGVPTPNIISKARKTFVQNFTKICESIEREQNDLSSYIAKELKIETSISGNGILIIHSTYKKNKIEELIKKYITNFVQCSACKHCDTSITKIAKINYIECKKCRAKTAIDMF